MTDVPIANPVVSQDAKERVTDVLESGMLADGDMVRAFEAEFADYIGVEHAVATSSGTTALHAMLEASGIGDGDVVLTTPFSFIASANAVRHAGAEVAFADVREDTYNLDPAPVRDVLTERDDVTALLPVHLYGLPADMGQFKDIAREHDLTLVEDAAQAHGGMFQGRMVGSLGDAAAFSFYPTKNMTTGEGGMIVTDDDDIASLAEKLVNHGRDGPYEHSTVGYNYRMTNVNAAIGRSQLERLPGWLDRRRANATRLTAGLIEIEDIHTPCVPSGRTHAYHQYTIRTEQRERVKTHLDRAGIGYGTYYPKPIPKQRPYREHNSHPVSERLSENVLSLPVHPTVDDTDVQCIVTAIREAMVT